MTTSATTRTTRGTGNTLNVRHPHALPDIVWMTPSADVMSPEDWSAGFGRSIGVFLNGNGIRGGNARGARVVDDSFLLLFNAHDQTLEWTLPPEEYAPAWRLVIDTSGVPDQVETVQAGSTVKVVDKGMVVLQAPAAAEDPPTPGTAAAAVPTVAPVPVPMRPDHRRPDHQRPDDQRLDLPRVTAETPRRKKKG